MTSKEALKLIYNSLINDITLEEDEFYNPSDDIKYWKEKYNIVKQALERLELLESENQELKEDFLKPIGFMCGTRANGELRRKNLIYLANKYNLPITIIDSETNNKCRKLEKALEIIKNKKVNMFHIWAFDDYEQYKEHYPFSEYNAREDMLTFEEFNFLKEVLENE